jgi:peptide/nickel transport system substrate-binding protein
MRKRRKPAVEVVNDNVAEPLTEQDRLTMAECVDDYRRAQITRRDFVQRSAAFGLSVGSLGAILAEVGPVAGSAEAAVRQGRLRKLAVGLESDADTLDPQAFRSVTGYHVTGNIYDSLGYHAWAKKGELLVVNTRTFGPLIATSRRITNRLTRIVYTIRPGVKFEDGSPLTIDDVLWTFERAVNGTQYTAAIAPLLRWSKTKPVEKVNERTVAMNFEGPSPMAPLMLGMVVFSILSKSAGEAKATKKDKYADAFWRANVVGNGAYLFRDWQRGQGWNFVPNPNYWNKARLPRNGGVAVRIVTDPQQRLSLLRAGQLNLVNGVPPKDAAALRGHQTARVLSAPSTWTFGLFFNNTVKPFNNKQVRQALSYAVPYDRIIKDVMFGLARRTAGLVPPGMPTYDPSLMKYNTDLKMAKELLTSAGYPNGLESKITVLQGRAQDEDAATFIQASFRLIGVNVSIEKLQAAAFQDARNNKKYQMMIGEWLSWVNDPFYHMYWNLDSKSTFTNNTGYKNVQVDKLIAGNTYAINAAKRSAASRQAQKLIIDDAPWAWLYVQDFYFPVTRNFHNLFYGADQLLRLQHSYLSG